MGDGNGRKRKLNDRMKVIRKNEIMKNDGRSVFMKIEENGEKCS